MRITLWRGTLFALTKRGGNATIERDKSKHPRDDYLVHKYGATLMNGSRLKLSLIFNYLMVKLSALKFTGTNTKKLAKRNLRKNNRAMKVIVNEEMRKTYNKANTSTVDLLEGKQYDVIDKKEVGKYYKRYRIVDESGEAYLYPQALFDIVEE